MEGMSDFGRNKNRRKEGQQLREINESEAAP